jgi:hypothetical protein
VALTRAEHALLVMRDDRPGPSGEVQNRPELWFSLEDVQVHMSTEGTGRDPSVTKFEWSGHSLRLEQVNGTTRAVYTDPMGGTRTFSYDGSTVTQSLMEDSPESALDRALNWFMTARHHPVVDKAFETVEAVAKWMAKADVLYQDAKQALPKAHTLFVTEPILTAATPSASAVKRVLGELKLRTSGVRVENSGAFPTIFPDDVFQRDQATQQLVPARYPPPRVPCMREYRNKQGIMTMVKFACAATTEDCQAVSGHAFDRRADCDDWCERQQMPPAILASYDPATHQLLCYQQECSQEFLNWDYPGLANQVACAAGCAHDLCAGEVGACEIPTENAQGQSYIVCKHNLTRGVCEAGPTAEAFHAGKKCEDVGYRYYDTSQSVWRMNPPTSYDAGTPKLDAGTDAPRTDAGTDGGGSTTTKVCNGRFEILEVGSPPPASCDNYSTNCTGSGRVRDTSTGLIWTRNELASVFRSDFTGATSKCNMIGMRVPTLGELRGVVPVACKDAVHWRAIPFMTSTDHPDPDPAWHWCVTYPGGKEDYCVNNVGLVCVKSP